MLINEHHDKEELVPESPSPLRSVTPENTAPEEISVTPLTEPHDGIPPVIADTAGLLKAAQAFSVGEGPVAVDAERASGYRYGQRAFLVQMRRKGAGTILLDPTTLPDLRVLNDAIADTEWIFHAASQDLPCLHELGLYPSYLFDTEVAARLLNYPRVGLAAVVESTLNLGLAKEHSAADWSTRPLPTDWLRYAALDVEVLTQVRDVLEVELQDAGKLTIAFQEFEHIRLAPTPPPKRDPWRKTSGIHALRDPRSLAIARELWTTRDRVAQQRDISPGRVLPDSAIVAAATAKPRTIPELVELPVFSGKQMRRQSPTWMAPIDRAMGFADSELPRRSAPHDGPPHPKSWADKNPVAARRLGGARELAAKLAAELDIPAENLLQPDTLRRISWTPPSDVTDVPAIAARLEELGARQWQIDAVAQPLSEVFVQAIPEPVKVDD